MNARPRHERCGQQAFDAKAYTRVKARWLLPIVLIGACGAVGLAAFIVFSSPVNRDANYFLLVGREILAGRTPGHDVHSSYSPFAFYIYALWFRCFGDSHLSVQFSLLAVQGLNACLVWFNLRRLVRPHWFRLLLSLCFFIGTVICDGMFLVLEPFQVTFALLAFLSFFSIRPQWAAAVVSGLMWGCSVMCKQYSAAMLLGFCIWLARDEGRSKRIGALARAALVPACSTLPLLGFIILARVNILEFLGDLGFIGGTATSYAKAGMGVLERISHLSRMMRYYIWIFPIFPCYAYLRITGCKTHRFFDAVFCVGCASMLPLAVRAFSHYFQLVIPWSCFLWAAVLTTCHSPKRTECDYSKMSYRGQPLARRVCVLVGLACLVLLFRSFMLVSLKIPRLNNERLRQRQEQRILNSYFAPGLEVYVVERADLYFLCNWFDPLHSYGFRSDPQPIISISERVAVRGRNMTERVESALENSGFYLIVHLADQDIFLYER